MKKRTVQIIRSIAILCILVALLVVPSVALAKNTTSGIIEQVIINEKTVWRYLDNNTDPAQGYDNPKAWTLIDYDDSSWKSASGRFGSKNGKLDPVGLFTPTTLLTLNDGVSDSNYSSYFFRTVVTVDNFDDVYGLAFTINANNGAEVYVNGKRVLNTCKTPVDGENLFYTYSTADIFDVWFDKDEVKELLHEGENIISASVHNSHSSSSDVYFDLLSNIYYAEGDIDAEFDNVVLGIGKDESERNLNWYTTAREDGEVQWAKADGTAFPGEYNTAKALTERADATPVKFSNSATITGLEPNTEYVYRLKCGDEYSDVYSFKTGSTDNFSFTVFGDAQLGSRTDDIEYWSTVLDKVDASFNSDFYISVGDQVNNYNGPEKEYSGFITEHLASNTIATVKGNHDVDDVAYAEHFNVPNELSEKISNYYFAYNNVLFIGLDNVRGSDENHKNTITEAINTHPECDWRIVVMHYAPFSAGRHGTNDTSVTDLRSNLIPYFETYGIDVVLGGHDHIYTRTYLMDGEEVMTDQSTVDTDGILYITAGSSCKKFYDTSYVDTNAEFVAYTYYNYNSVVMQFEVSGGSLSFKTYLTESMNVIDSYELTVTNSARLSTAIDDAEAVLNEATTIGISETEALSSIIATATSALTDIDNYTYDEVSALINLIIEEKNAVFSAISDYNKISEGAVKTAFDSVTNLTTVHLEAGGVYSLSGGGSKTDINLIKNNSDGTTTTVYTWREGSTYVKQSSSNPYVAFILDGDVTFENLVKFEYTHLLIDLNGYNITFNTNSNYHVNISAASSIEFRGNGKVIAGTGTVDYFLATATYIGVATFNGDITFVDGTSALKTVFLFKGDAYVHGTLTIDKSYDSSTGMFFNIQGSRSSADDRRSILTFDKATVYYNNPKGGALLGSKGIVGEYNGKTYSSIPEVKIQSSTFYLSSPLITQKWGADSVSGYATSKSEALTGCVNTNSLTIRDSKIYADIRLGTPIVINPKGHTFITVDNSTIETEQGVIFSVVANTTFDLVANNSIFLAKTSDTEAQALATELGIASGSYAPLRGEVLYAPANSLGTAIFNDCSLTSSYRIIEGTSDTISKRTYFSFLNNCASTLAANGHAFARSNIVINGGAVDCGNGKITNNSSPYNPETGKGVLVIGTVTISNFPSSELDDEIKTISQYKELNTYDTVLTSGYFTVADDYNVLKLDDPTNLEGKYTFLIYSDDHAPVLTLHNGTAPTCTQAGTKDYYTCFCGLNYADADGKIVIDDLDAWLPIAALGHTSGVAVKENSVEPNCTESGSYDSVVYCTVCNTEVSRQTITVNALGHTEKIIAGKDPNCTESGLTESKMCTVCGETLITQNEIPALGHDYNTVITAPDCTNGGYTTYTCSVCGYTYTADETEALGHSYDAVVTAPNCTNGGYTTYTCTTCGDNYVADMVGALGHTAGDALTENTVAPTCTENGSYDVTTYCTICGAELTRDTFTVSALGHIENDVVENIIEATCTDEGSYDIVNYCSVCGVETLRENVISAALGHTKYAVAENIVNATCTEDGSYDIVLYCSTCEIEIERETVVTTAHGHSYSEFTSNSDGIHTRVCSNDPAHTETESCQGGTATETALAVCSVCHGEYGDYAEPDNTTENIPDENIPDNETESAPAEDEKAENIEVCNHICHSTNAFEEFLWKLINFFSKLFGTNGECKCGEKHY